MTDITPQTWIRYELDHLGLSLDVFADQPSLTVRRDATLTTLTQEQNAVRLVVWAGPDQTLESWRERLDVRDEARFEPQADVMVCGTPARRQTATVTQGGAVGVFKDGQGGIGHVYQEASTRVHTCVSFSHAGQNVLLCWVVDKDAQSARAADEHRFFASVQCR